MGHGGPSRIKLARLSQQLGTCDLGRLPVRVHIDYERCVGHARCIAECPNVFGSDEYGRGAVKMQGPVAPADHEGVRNAARACPEEAVIICERD